MNQQPNTQDRLELAIVKHQSDLNAAKNELKNENLTDGQHRALHVEIEQLTFSLKTLKFVKG